MNAMIPMSTDPFVEALKNTPTGLQAQAEIERARVAERQAHADALDKLRRNEEKAWPARQAEIAKLREQHDVNVKAMQASGFRLDQAIRASGGASMQFSHLVAVREGELVKTADPAIDEFISEMWGAIDVARRAFSFQEVPGARDLEGRRRGATVHSNKESVERRVAAIRTAIVEAEALRLRPDQAGARARLAFLRSGLPKVEAVVIASDDEPKGGKR